MEKTADSYELTERAAIREFDGGMNKTAADAAAMSDIRQRRQLQQRSTPELIRALQGRRQEVVQQLAATRDRRRIAELSSEWTELSRQIIKANRKEAK